MRLSYKSLLSASLLCLLGAVLPAANAKEGFEKLKKGKFTDLQIQYGAFKCADGVAEVINRGKNSGSALRMFGGDKTELKLTLKESPQANVKLTAWAERWTNAAPFEFSIVAQGADSEKEIYNGRDIKTGGFNTKIDAIIPAGAKSLVFKLTTPPDKGLMLDDLMISDNTHMVVDKNVEVRSDVYPVIARIKGNPVMMLNVRTKGSKNPLTLNTIGLDFTGTTNLNDIESVTVIRSDEAVQNIGGGHEFPKDASQVLGTVKMADAKNGKLQVKGHGLTLAPEDNPLWVCVTLKENASIDGKIVVKPTHIGYNHHDMPAVGVIEIKNAAPVTQRIGTAVVKQGDFNSKFYRIPGLARTKKGSLLAVFDIRYNHAGDLPANIDVGVSRSTDEGHTWSPVKIAINDSEIAPNLGLTKGVGDPAILVDEATGRVWVAAIWSHKHSIRGSKAGDNSPEACGQLVLAYSDDDGQTWSKPINITEQTKQLKWHILFNGPGCGICMKNGDLVFAAQYWDENNKPWSTIVYSKDKGKTWHCGMGVNIETTEAQVIELLDGSIMINARCNRKGARVVGVTKDYGKTWIKHATNRTDQLKEPTCQGSLLAIDQVPNVGRVVLFSNPNTNTDRSHMTLKASTDDAGSWPQDKWLLYDVRPCWGYSCLAPAGKDHIGVLYESSGGLYYLRIPYAEIFKGK